jgi:hypothetical protein
MEVPSSTRGRVQCQLPWLLPFCHFAESVYGETQQFCCSVDSHPPKAETGKFLLMSELPKVLDSPVSISGWLNKHITILLHKGKSIWQRE